MSGEQLDLPFDTARTFAVVEVAPEEVPLQAPEVEGLDEDVIPEEDDE